jgi:D-alanine--poly(phosphoribitol) ligase subunit 1
MLVAFLGAAKAGRPYGPIDSSIPPQRQERILAIAGAGVVLTPDRVDGLTSRDALAPPLDRRDADPYYIMFTSGSTGEPKGVIITHGCLASFLTWMVLEHRFAPGRETFLNQAPFSFDLSVMDLYLSLVTGGTLVSLSAEEVASPRQLYRALETSGATVWVSTPSFAQLCLAEPAFAGTMMPALQRFLFCGETLPPGVAAQLMDRFPSAEVWNTYDDVGAGASLPAGDRRAVAGRRTQTRYAHPDP